MRDGVKIGDTIVSNVAIVILNATSPPAINVYKLAEVPLGTVPANTIPEAISGIFFINNRAINSDIPTVSVHFNKKPYKAYFGLFITFIICSVDNDIP